MNLRRRWQKYRKEKERDKKRKEFRSKLTKFFAFKNANFSAILVLALIVLLVIQMGGKRNARQ